MNSSCIVISFILIEFYIVILSVVRSLEKYRNEGLFRTNFTNTAWRLSAVINVSGRRIVTNRAFLIETRSKFVDHL